MNLSMESSYIPSLFERLIYFCNFPINVYKNPQSQHKYFSWNINCKISITDTKIGYQLSHTTSQVLETSFSTDHNHLKQTLRYSIRNIDSLYLLLIVLMISIPFNYSWSGVENANKEKQPHQTIYWPVQRHVPSSWKTKKPEVGTDNQEEWNAMARRYFVAVSNSFSPLIRIVVARRGESCMEPASGQTGDCVASRRAASLL